MKEEQIPVLLSQATTVEREIPVVPEAVYVIEVLYSFQLSLNSVSFLCACQYLFDLSVLVHMNEFLFGHNVCDIHVYLIVIY